MIMLVCMAALPSFAQEVHIERPNMEPVPLEILSEGPDPVVNIETLAESMGFESPMFNGHQWLFKAGRHTVIISNDASTAQIDDATVNIGSVPVNAALHMSSAVALLKKITGLDVVWDPIERVLRIDMRVPGLKDIWGRRISDFTRIVLELDGTFPFRINIEKDTLDIFIKNCTFDTSIATGLKSLKSVLAVVPAQHGPDIQLAVTFDKPILSEKHHFIISMNQLMVDVVLQSTILENANKPNELPVFQMHSRRHVIVIDPGHGGRDPGVTGKGKKSEKEIALLIAKSLKRQLMTSLASKMDIDVVLTRNRDYWMDDDERAAAANGQNASLFISLHSGYGLHPAASGLRIFVRSPSHITENGAETGKSLVVNWDRAQDRFLARSYDFATDLAQTLKKSLGRNTIRLRGVMTAPVYGLRSLNMPAVQVEFGCLSNLLDARRLEKASVRHAVVIGLARGIEKYAMENWK